MKQYLPYREGEIARLGNFYLHFRVENLPFAVSMPDGLYRTSLREEGYWEMTFHDRIRQIARSEHDYHQYCLERSQQKLAQTPAQFYDVVDWAVVESRIPASCISRAINVLIGDAEDISRKFDTLTHLLFPVYIILRHQGYVIADLCR